MAYACQRGATPPHAASGIRHPNTLWFRSLLKLTLDQIEQVKRDVYAKADDLAKASEIFATLIAFQDVHQTLSGDPYMFQRRDFVEKKMKELFDRLGIRDSPLQTKHMAVMGEYRKYLQSIGVKIDEQFWKELVQGYIEEKPQQPPAN